MSDEKIVLLKDRIEEYFACARSGDDSARTYLLSDFREFIRAFHYITENAEFIFKPFHEELITMLEEMVFDNPFNLLIDLPPRAGKSEVMVYFICWTYAINPFCNNIYTCYNDDLVGKFSIKMKKVIESDLYKALFQIYMSEDVTAKSYWKVRGGGETRAISINGGITGFGAGIAAEKYGGSLFIDDPMKPNDARSGVMRQTVIDNFNQVLKSRRNNLLRTPIVILMQRVHRFDLAGYVRDEIAKGNLTNWRVLSVKALKTDENGKEESFWEERYPLKVLQELRRGDEYTFMAQYQQEPVLLGGNVIKTDKFRTYKELPQLLYTKIFADTAMTAKTSSDYTVFGLFGYTADKNCYLIDIWRGKWEVPEMMRQAETIWQNLRAKGSAALGYPIPRCMAIENKASGIGLIQDFRRKKIPVEVLEPKMKDPKDPKKWVVADKFQKVSDILYDVEVGTFYVPAAQLGKEWLPAFITECQEFSGDDSHAHDDQVDVFVYAMQEREKGFFNPRF